MPQYFPRSENKGSLSQPIEDEGKESREVLHILGGRGKISHILGEDIKWKNNIHDLEQILPTLISSAVKAVFKPAVMTVPYKELASAVKEEKGSRQ